MLLILKSMKDCELKSKALLVRGINDNSDLAAPKVREVVLHAKGGTIRVEVSKLSPCWPLCLISLYDALVHSLTERI
jgi:hypothetical protein